MGSSCTRWRWPTGERTHFESRSAHTAPTGKRLWILRRALGGFRALSCSTGKCVEMLLGLCTYAALTCRMLLCIFDSAYAFVQSAGEKAVRSWPSVSWEFRHVHGFLPLCLSDWTRQCSPYVTQTDASETGSRHMLQYVAHVSYVSLRPHH